MTQTSSLLFTQPNLFPPPSEVATNWSVHWCFKIWHKWYNSMGLPLHCLSLSITLEIYSGWYMKTKPMHLAMFFKMWLLLHETISFLIIFLLFNYSWQKNTFFLMEKPVPHRDSSLLKQESRSPKYTFFSGILSEILLSRLKRFWKLNLLCTFCPFFCYSKFSF